MNQVGNSLLRIPSLARSRNKDKVNEIYKPRSKSLAIIRSSASASKVDKIFISGGAIIEEVKNEQQVESFKSQSIESTDSLCTDSSLQESSSNSDKSSEPSSLDMDATFILDHPVSHDKIE